MSGTPRTLPPRRPSATLVFELFDGYAAQDYCACYAEFGSDANGRGDLAEVFLTPVGGPNAKVGMPLDLMAKDLSVLFSIARRYGAPVAVIRGALSQAADGAMLGPLGEFLRRHAGEPPIVPPADPDDPSSPAGAVSPVPPLSGEGGEAVATSCSADPPGLAASFEGGAP